MANVKIAISRAKWQLSDSQKLAKKYRDQGDMRMAQYYEGKAVAYSEIYNLLTVGETEDEPETNDMKVRTIQ